MKIAICLGQFSIGTRPLDFWFNNINDSTRGLTGTDLSFCEIANAMALRGHEVHMFTVHAQPGHKPDTWRGIKLYNYHERVTVVDESFDCILSINEPDTFRGMNQKPLRACWQFLNDFTYCSPGFPDFVDQWLGVCETHVNHLKSQILNPEKWKVLRLGCDPNLYNDARVPGRVVWTSSADRGLHWLMQQWPVIKKCVPHATLKVFYHFNYGDNLLSIEPNDKVTAPSIVELSQRVRYMKTNLPRLKGLDVEHVGSVSRSRMAKELSEASVFAFSCDTVAFTEGFSVSTLEAHASYTVPVITNKDCLGSIYKDSGCIMVDAKFPKNLDEYTNLVIKSLTDNNFADSVIAKCREFAAKHSWPSIAKDLDDIIKNHPKMIK